MGKSAEILIYEDIGDGWFGGLTAKAFAEQLKEIGKVDILNVYINSPGGSVFEGIAMYNMLVRFAARKIVHIDGIAASIASIIALAGDERQIAANAMVMIHDPWSMAVGTAGDLRKEADSLDKVRGTLLGTYVARTGGDEKVLSNQMTDETWMTAQEALDAGFCTSITEAKVVQANFPLLAKYAKVPESLKRQATANDARLARMTKRIQQLRSAPNA